MIMKYTHMYHSTFACYGIACYGSGGKSYKTPALLIDSNCRLLLVDQFAVLVKHVYLQHCKIAASIIAASVAVLIFTFPGRLLNLGDKTNAELIELAQPTCIDMSKYWCDASGPDR